MSLEGALYITFCITIVVGFAYEVFSQPPIVRRKHPNPAEAKRRYAEKMKKQMKGSEE